VKLLPLLWSLRVASVRNELRTTDSNFGNNLSIFEIRNILNRKNKRPSLKIYPRQCSLTPPLKSAEMRGCGWDHPYKTRSAVISYLVNPLTPTVVNLSYGYSLSICARPGWAVICNFWHPGTLTLSAERQSERMSKITNDGLTRSGAGCFITVPITELYALNQRKLPRRSTGTTVSSVYQLNCVFQSEESRR